MAVKKNLNEKKEKKEKHEGKWNLRVQLDGIKEAEMLARTEKLPAPSESFDDYPVDLLLPGKVNFFTAIRKAIIYSGMGIYSMIFKD